MTTLGLEPIFGSYWLVLVAIGGLLAALTISPAFASTSMRRARILLGLRLGVIFLLAMGMLRPTVVRTGLREEQSTIAILLDASRSMSVADVQDKTRWESALKTLNSALRDRGSAVHSAVPIQPYVFSETVRSVPPRGQSWDYPTSPAGNQTDLGGALDGTLRAHATSALAAVIVLSDGAQRTMHPSVPLAQPAHELGRRGVPLITIPFGRTREQSQSRDISVETMPDAFESFVKNEVVVRAVLRQQGFAKHPIPSQLLVESPDGQKEVVGPVITQSQSDLEQLTVEFSVTPQIPGEYRLTLEVPPQPGEQVTDNNKLRAFLDVLDGGLRVLYLDGNVG